MWGSPDVGSPGYFCIEEAEVNELSEGFHANE